MNSMLSRDELVSIINNLFKNSPALISVFDRQGRYVMVSESIAQIIGLTIEEIQGRPFYELLPETLVEEFYETIQEIVRDKKHLVKKDEIPFGDGIRIFETTLFPIRTVEGEVELIGSVAIDITERKKAEGKILQKNLEIITITNNIPDIIARYDKELRHIYINKRAQDYWGITLDTIIGKTNRELGMPSSVVDKWEEKLRLAFVSKEEQVTELNYETAKGRRYYHSVITPEICSDGVVDTVISIFRDITEMKELQLALDTERKNLKITMESIGDGVIATDNQGKVKLLNKVAHTLTGWTQEEAYNKLTDIFHIVNEFTRETCENPVEKVLETEETIELANHTILIAKDGTERPIENSAAPIRDQEGHINGVVLVFRDFTEKKQKQKEIRYLSIHDQLTGLYNRGFFENELKKLDVENNLPLTLVMADVNGLKLINDGFGHSAGDKLLQKAAGIIKKECRAGDIIARYGGDEFIILLTKTSSKEAEKIIKRIRKSFSHEKIESIPLSISFGWATKKTIWEDISLVFKNAEDNMYRRKLYEGPSMRSNAIKTIVSTLYEKSKREQQHSERVSQFCEKMGETLGLSSEEVAELRAAGLLHDIGKITLDEKLINKAGKLNESEWLEIKRHPEIGYRILSSVNELAELAEYVLLHHESWDGTGYPKGLKGKEIPLQARIIAIADAYDAMTSYRPYREAMLKDDAIKELQRCAGIQFDPYLVEVFTGIV